MTKGKRQNDRQCSTKHSTENHRLINTNSTKILGILYNVIIYLILFQMHNINERACICVLGVLIVLLSTTLILYFETVPTLFYYLFFIFSTALVDHLFVTLSTMTWYVLKYE
jgi:hypothetical protein